MLDQQEFSDRIFSFHREILALADTDDITQIAVTADRLERLNYAPPVHLSLHNFLNLTSSQVIDEINRITQESQEAWDNPLEQKLQKISILVFYYKELIELRHGTAEAWDEVDELYVHD